MRNGAPFAPGRRLAAFAGLLAAVAIGAGFFASAPVAQADTYAVAVDGSLTWKVSQQAWTASSLVPSHATTAPATKDSENGFVFPQGQGTYDPETGEAHVDFTGALQLGNVSQGGYKIQFANPSVVIDDDGAGSIIADVVYCTGTAACANPWVTVTDVTIVTFDADNGTLTDDGESVTLTVTPDYVLQGDSANPARRQFNPGLVGNFADTPAFSTGALPTSLVSHFRDSGAGADVNKPPAPFTLKFDYAVIPSASQTIRTQIVATGAISMSVASNEVSLPSPSLNGTSDALVSTGSIAEVTVTDLRSANPGWNINGQVSDFTSGADSFGAELLGWTPAVVSSSSGQTVTAGTAVAPGVGLADPATLGSAAAGQGRGTAVLDADLNLEIPVETAPGEYSTTLTLTVI